MFAESLLKQYWYFANSTTNLIDKEFKVVITVIGLEDSGYNFILLSVKIAMLAKIVKIALITYSFIYL